MSDIIFKKISLLKGYIENLENFLLKCRDGVADESVFLSIERLFQLIVDEAVDINAIILEKEGKPFPDTNQATFEATERISFENCWFSWFKKSPCSSL